MSKCTAARAPGLPCLLPVKNNSMFCPVHALFHNNKIYTETHNIPSDRTNTEGDYILLNQLYKNHEIHKAPLNTNKNVLSKISIPNNIAKVVHEQKLSTLDDNYQDNIDTLSIKLLVLVNDDKYYDIIPELIGPVYKDITLSEDDQDPITYDVIWTTKNGIRVPGEISKYYLFSYRDTDNKIRCFTIFTIHDMIKEGNFTHPITLQEIPPYDVDRARRLIKIYDEEIGLFNDHTDLSPEFKLRNRVVKLFKTFHHNSIYLEEEWLLSITDFVKLKRLIQNTHNLVKNNLSSINPKIKTCSLFSMPIYSSMLDLQVHFIQEWEKLISLSDTPNNQIPIWIPVIALAEFTPMIKQKYPNINAMI